MKSFLLLIYAFSFFDRLLLIFPLYTLMLVDAKLSPVEITICLTTWSLTGFMLQVPSGVVADRWSRRHILAWSQAVRATGLLMWLLYPHFWGFLIGLVLWGVKSAFTSGTFEALLYDELRANRRAADYTRIYGRTRAVQSGAVVLAALGAAAAARFGYGLLLVASLVSAGLAAWAAISLPPAPASAIAARTNYSAHLRAGLVASFREPTVLSILCFSAVVLALGASLEEFWPVFGAKLGLARSPIAIFVSFQNAVEVLVSLVAYRLSGLPTRGFYGLFAVAGLVLMGAAALFIPAALLLLASYSGVMKLVAIVFEGRMQHVIPTDQRATIGSVKSFLGQIGIIALYAVFGPLAQATSYRSAFLCCGAAAAVIGLSYGALSSFRPGRVARLQAERARMTDAASRKV